MLERRDDAVVGYPRHSTTTRMMDTTSSPILHHQQQPSTTTTTTTRKKRDVSKEDDDPDDPDDSDDSDEEEEKQMEDAEDKTEHKASPTRPHQSRARRKKNEAIAAVTELYRLHDVDKKTNFRLTSEQLYDKMVSLVHCISTKVERSNMVQMWVPRLAGKSVVMTTHNELCKITAKKKTHDSLLAKKFSENSTAFFFNCESTNGEGLLGLPGRCYVLSRPEFTPSVTSYRPLEYVRVACAYECQIHTTLCMPVFLTEEAMNSERPFTILEVALCHTTNSIGELYANVVQEFMKLGFYTTGHDRVGPERYMKKFIESTVTTLAPGHANALKLMCDTLNIPFAQFWIESNGILVAAGCPYHVKEEACKNYRDMSSQISLMIGQGPVGQAYSNETLIWVDDVQKASQIEWPLHHTSILLGLRGLCACKMRIDCILPDGTRKKTDAILEIILNPKLQTSAEQTKSVEEVWSYLQKGVRVDVTKDGLKPPGSPLAAMVGSGQITGSGEGGDMLATNMGVPDSKDADTMTTTPNTEAITLQAIEDQAVEHISMVNEDQEEANKSAPWGITLELLQTQFSKQLKDAATDLGVGSTTLKRICRQYGIARWPRRSLKSKQNKALKEAAKVQNKLKKARSGSVGGHSSGNIGDSSFRSSGGSDIVAGESVHGPGDRMNGGGLLSNLTLENGGGGANGSPLGDGLFKMGSTGVPIISGGSNSPRRGGVRRGTAGNEERSHGGFQFAGIRGIKTRQFDWGDEHEPERGASWHAGSGFISHGRLKNAKGQIVASGSQHGGQSVPQFIGAEQHKMSIAPAMQQFPCPANVPAPNMKQYSKGDTGGGKSAVNAAPVSFDDHFYETVHGAHNFSQQLYPHHHYKDDSVHGSTYSESAHGGSHYSGSIHGKQGEDHSVHGTTALAGMLDNTLGGFGDDLFIGANDTLEDADADMMAILLNEGGKVEEVPQLIVKLRVGKDTIRFRLLHKWSVSMLLDRIRKLIVFPDSSKLKYMDDEDDMCILQTEHDLEECIRFTEHRKKEGRNSGDNKSATNEAIGGENNNIKAQQQQQQLLATGFSSNKPNGGEITIFASLKDGSMPSLDAYVLVKQDIHSIPPSLSASVNARRDQLTINVKVSQDNDTCRFLLEPKMNHAKLLEHIVKLFAIKDSLSRYRLTYLDDSEEWITLAGDLDLDECRALCGSSPSLRMKLLKC